MKLMLHTAQAGVRHFLTLSKSSGGTSYKDAFYLHAGNVDLPHRQGWQELQLGRFTIELPVMQAVLTAIRAVRFIGRQSGQLKLPFQKTKRTAHGPAPPVLSAIGWFFHLTLGGKPDTL